MGEALVAVAEAQGFEILTGNEVQHISVERGKVTGVQTESGFYQADLVVGSADYNHVEQKLLQKEYRQYSPQYWESRVMAPSSLLFYLGVNKRLRNLKHHNLFFDRDFGKHSIEIYEDPAWPSDPLFYVCAPSVTDPTVAPAGHENLFVLIPVAPGLEDNEALRERYYHIVMERLETLTGQSVRDHVVYK